MKKTALLAALTALLFLAACGAASSQEPDSQVLSSMGASSASSSASSKAASSGSTASSASGKTSRAKTAVLNMVVEGDSEPVPATLYVGDGYSLYVPDEGWSKSAGENSVTWISTDNELVGLSVTKFEGVSAADARAQYVENSGFIFEDQLENGIDEPLAGWDEDGDNLELMIAQNGGSVYIVAWTYPAEAAEGFGARLGQIANTFETEKQ